MHRDTLLRGKNIFLEIKSIGILDVSRATKPSYHRNFHLVHALTAILD